MRKLALIFFLTVLVFTIAQATRKTTHDSLASAHLPPAAIAALEKIDPEHIRAHVRYLSLDLLGGRGTGQRGGDIAAEYIARQFGTYGLKAAGDNGTFFQKVPMVGITPDPETTFALAPAKGDSMKLKPLDQYVGYGIEAPEYSWDDYKGVDVRGKVLLMLVNEPTSADSYFFKGRALTFYGRWVYKYLEAARKGAVGAILIHKSEMASYPWEVVRNSNSGERSLLKTDAPQLKAASWIQFDVAKQLAQKSGLDLDKMIAEANSRDFHPVELHAKLKAHMVSKVRPFSSNNVIAMLTGSDPKLKDEAV